MGEPKRKGPVPKPAAERFAAKIRDADNGCIEWIGSINGSGYGTFYAGNRTGVVAHRWSYEHHIGPIPAGLYLDHLCRNRKCVNPAHLEPVDQKENLRRGDTNASKTHCPSGHPYSAENTYYTPSTHQRQCRVCIHARSLARSTNRRKAKNLGRL